MEEYKDFWYKGLKYDGTASRLEFWVPTVANIFALFVLGLAAYAMASSIGFVFLFIAILFTIVIIPPQITVFIRRVHDTTKSGKYILWGLFPAIGLIIVFVALIEENKEY